MGLKVTFPGGMPSICCSCRTLFPQISKSQSSWPKFYLKAVACSQGSGSRAPLFSDPNLPLMGTDIVQATRTSMLPCCQQELGCYQQELGCYQQELGCNQTTAKSPMCWWLEQGPNDVGRGVNSMPNEWLVLVTYDVVRGMCCKQLPVSFTSSLRSFPHYVPNLM